MEHRSVVTRMDRLVTAGVPAFVAVRSCGYDSGIVPESVPTVNTFQDRDTARQLAVRVGRFGWSVCRS